MSASELLTQVLKLPRRERQKLAEQLWESLDRNDLEPDDDPPTDPNFLEELKRRVQLVKSGNHESLSVQESLELARKALAETRR